MNVGRFFLFARIIAGVLACVFSIKSFSADGIEFYYQGVRVGEPAGHCTSIASVGGWSISIYDNACSRIQPSWSGCTVYYKRSKQGQAAESYSCGYSIKKVKCDPPKTLVEFPEKSGIFVCQEPDKCGEKKGQNANFSTPDGFNAITLNTVCDEASKCEVSVVDAACTGDGVKYPYKCGLTGKYTGASCTSNNNPGSGPISPVPTPEPSKPQIDPYTCAKKGMNYGVVNGQSMCVPKPSDSPVTNTDTNTVKNPDGSTTTTNTSTTDNGNSVNTNTTTTTNTPTGGTRPNGTVCNDSNGCKDVESKSKDQSKSGFCEENPTSWICKNPNRTITADCDNFTCDSDNPIDCENARANWLNYCQLKVKDGDSSISDGQKLVSGEGFNEIKSDLLGKPEDAIDLTNSIKKERFLGGGRLSDKIISVGGRSFVIPFSQMNDWLIILGKIAVAVTLVAAARIVAGGVK